MISLSKRVAIAALCVLALPTFAVAQAPAPSDSAESNADPKRPIPTLMAMAVDSTVAFRPAQPEVAPTVRRRRAFDQPTTLMVVGAALIVTGALVDDEASTLLYLDGAGIGGYGLYLYMQRPTTRLVR